MQKLHITGGKPLHGEITAGGSKNAASKMMIASLLTDEPVTLHNCPNISEIDITAEICQAIGSKVERKGTSLTIHTPQITNTTVAAQSRRNRLSVLALGPLLHRSGHAELPVALGDQIGPRPVNFSMSALRNMGALIEESNDEYKAHTDGLHGATIRFNFPSVMATENVIIAAATARGRTYIHNAAIEPEIVELIKLLQQMGAIIEFRANRLIIIDGVERLGGAEFSVLPDRIAAASYGLMAIATEGDILVKDARQEDMMTFLNTLRRIGAEYRIEKEGIRFRRNHNGLIGIELETDTHPGFMTDWQQPLVVLLTQAKGVSVIHETVFEDRFGYTGALNAMGASIGVFYKCLGELPCRFKGKMHKHSAIVSGPTPLTAAEIEMPDIRAGMAYVLAAMIAEGTSAITGTEHLIRGYGPGFMDKLEAVGANFYLE